MLGPSPVPPASPPTLARPRSLRVAIVDEELPYPPTSGKRIRTLNLVLNLAREHAITYLSHRNADPAEARLAAEFLGDHGVSTVVADRAVPPKSGPAFYARLGANLLSPLPYSVASHRSRELREAARLHAAKGEVDVWQCEWTPYAEAVRDLPGARWVVVAHNVESLIWRRYEESEANPAKRWYIGLQRAKFERYERGVYAEADRVVAVSDEDAALIRSEFGGGTVDVVENGVDGSYFRPGDGPRDPGRLLFLGSLDWRPNLDAVKALLDDVFPAVRAEVPGATLAIVGRNPPPWLAEAASAAPGVELFGSVPDVRPHLAGASALAVPLRIGGGSRLKILEALASSLPVVSTRVGAEGLRLDPGVHLDVVEGVAEMVPALVRRLRDPEGGRRMAEAGRAVVLGSYDWGTLAGRLGLSWERAAGEPVGAGQGGGTR